MFGEGQDREFERFKFGAITGRQGEGKRGAGRGREGERWG